MSSSEHHGAPNLPRFAHANIRVADPHESVRFYRHLGLDIVGSLQLPDTYLLFLAPPHSDEACLELTVSPETSGIGLGEGHIALAVGDLDSVLARLAEVGITPTEEPFTPAGPDGPRICFLTDPDGVSVELIDGTFPTPDDTPPESFDEL